MYRRRFLLAGAATALAGCLDGGETDSSSDGGGDAGGDGSDAGGDGSDTDGASDGTAGGGDGQTLDSHPAARDLAGQPTLGPEPGAGRATVVVFEDPSCPICRRFEAEVVPKLRSQYVDSGDLSMVVRGYPIIYEWGNPATKALEATYAVDEAAFWALHGHYFAEQDAFRSAGPSAVYPRTESFLQAETDVDATAVVDGARDGAFDAAVQTDLDAGSAAGASATPALFLFRDGQFRTRTTGSVSFETITSVLQL